jgi:hypothetical protein
MSRSLLRHVTVTVTVPGKALPRLLCCRAPEGRLFRPYDLLVVTRESLGLYDEYFTVSANGVMTIRKGVQAEFVPLAEWVRQQSLFDSVSAIDFYKNYITGRAFRRWHNVRFSSLGMTHTWCRVAAALLALARVSRRAPAQGTGSWSACSTNSA